MKGALHFFFITMAAALTIAASGSSSVQPSVLAHERLRIHNTFKTPQEVVSYYCARDASGFVWSGLLESERKAFTLWREAPEQDSFYVAKNYEISAPKIESDHATVEVQYEVTAIADAHGTKIPPPNPKLRVVFDLKKIDGVWKIALPEPNTLSPVVLESKFPISGT